MDFSSLENGFLSDLELIINNEQVDQIVIQKSIFKLLFSLFNQMSKMPFIFSNFKNEIDLNVNKILQNFHNEIEVLKKNQENIQKQLKENEKLMKFPLIYEKPNDYEADVFQACKNGKLTSIQYQIEIENVDKNIRTVTSDIDNKFSKKEMLIHIASKNGHLPIVEYLIEKQNVDINIKGGFKEQTPLHYACENGHLPVVEYLISKSANVNAKDKYGDYIIHSASKGGLLPIVEYLIEQQNIDKDLKGFDHKTPLQYACENSNFAIVTFLISKCANIQAIDIVENHVIHYASQGGIISLVQKLIEQKNVDINIKGFCKKTPLQYACENGKLSIVEYLISKGANANSKDINGNYVIHYASKGGLLPIVQYFIEQQNVDIDIKGYYEKIPLQYACENGHLQIAQYLISKGANINIKDRREDHVIHYASKGGHLPVVQYLIEKENVDINNKATNGASLLHCACRRGKLHIVKYLISQGANINEKDEDGQTPLHYAAGFYSLDVVKFLLTKGANKYARDKDGRTPYDISKFYNIRNILK